MTRSLIAAVTVAGAILCSAPARAFHTVFDFAVDRVELDGNTAGPADGVADRVDDFSDGTIAPEWYVPFYDGLGFIGTVTESGGLLHLSSPGVHYPGPDGLALDVSIAASNPPFRVNDGGGDFAVTAYWQQAVPPPGHHFHFSLFTYGSTGGLYNEIFGLAILGTETGLQVEQHLTELDQFAGVYHNTLFEFVDVAAAEVTGQIVFRLEVDDATNTATSAFSLDGGTSWQAPFASAPIFVGRTQAQLILSADPQVAGPVPTTSTTSTTSTTLPPGSCTPVGCARATGRGRLAIIDQPGEERDWFSWKWRKGEAVDPVLLGTDPAANFYEFCMADVTGQTIFSATVPGGGPCSFEPCWTRASTRGVKYRDPTAFRGIASIALMNLLTPGKASVTVKGQGAEFVVPPLPLALPVTVRLRGSDGACWAAVFDADAMLRNTDAQFRGRPSE